MIAMRDRRNTQNVAMQYMVERRRLYASHRAHMTVLAVSPSLASIWICYIGLLVSLSAGGDLSVVRLPLVYLRVW